MLLRSISLLALAATLGASTPLAAQNAAQGALLARALDAAAAGDWRGREDLRRPTPATRSPTISCSGSACATAPATGTNTATSSPVTPTGPALAALRRAGERQMPSGQPPATVLAFFDGRPPETGTGALRLAEALSTAGREAEAEAEIVRAWTTFSMTAAERAAMLGRWKDALAGHHEARIDMLLWRGLTSEAEAMMTLVSAGLAEARPGAHRHPPRRRRPAVRHQPGAAGARATIPASPTSATSTG